MKFGCVQFDDDKPGPGWASIGGEQAFRIRSTGDLKSDVQWLTSLNYDKFSQSGFSNHPTLRSSGFLRTELNALKEEFGCESRHMKTSESTEFISEIFSRIMYLAKHNFGIQQSTNTTLARDIREVLMPPDEGISDEMDEALKHAWQPYARCERNPKRQKTKAVTFRRSRYQHAKDVISVPVPGERWEFISSKSLPKNDVISWILKQDRPCLIRGALDQVPPEMSPLVSFGGGSAHVRSWISHPELLLLSQHCKLSVDAIFMADEYVPISTKKKLPVVDGLSELSISLGILSENYWVGLSMQQPPKFGDYVLTPRAVWMRACDRSHMFMPAMQLHLAGFHVQSYGVGSVTVSVPFGQLQKVIEVAGDAELMPPISASGDAAIHEELS